MKTITKNTRLYALDNLRTLLILLVLVYHASLVYQSALENTWIVVDSAKSKALGILGLILDSFVMFSFFFISGYFMRESSQRKSAKKLIVDKIKRILIPWCIAVITLIPVYKYIFLKSRLLPAEPWYSYFHFFKNPDSDLHLFSQDPTQSWLWFLPVLFLFQMLYLFLNKQNLLPKKLKLSHALWIIFISGVLYSKLISGMGLRGWTYSYFLDFQNERLLLYFSIFLLGSLSHKLQVLQHYKRNKKHYILGNITMSLGLTFYIVIALNFFFNLVYPERNYFFISQHIDSAAYYGALIITMLSFLYILIDIFLLKGNASDNWLNKLAKNSYPVYIIHIPVIGFLACALLSLEISPMLKFGLLSIASIISSYVIVYLFRKILNKIKD